MAPSERHHFQALPVTPRPARCRSGPPCARPNTSVASRHPSPPRVPARDRAHSLGHAGAHSLTLPLRLPRRGPSSRSAPVRGSQGSATEADPVGSPRRCPEAPHGHQEPAAAYLARRGPCLSHLAPGARPAALVRAAPRSARGRPRSPHPGRRRRPPGSRSRASPTT